jgi:type II secretory pathway component PulF
MIVDLLWHHPAIAELRDRYADYKRQRHLTADHRYRLYLKLAGSLKADLSTQDALRHALNAVRLGTGRTDHPQAIALQAWHRASADKPFAEAIRGWVPAHEQMLIAAAEQYGRLPAGLERVREFSRDFTRMSGAIRSAIVVPSVSLVAAFIGGVGGSRLMLEQLRAKARFTVELEGFARFYEIVFDFLWSNMYWITALIPLATVAIIIAIPNLTGPYRVLLDRVRPFRYYRLQSGVFFLAGLSFLLTSGCDIIQAVRTMLPHTNPYERERLAAILRLLVAGYPIGEALVQAGTSPLNPNGFGYPDPELNHEIIALAGRAGFPAALEQLVQHSLTIANATIESEAHRLTTSGFAIVGAVLIFSLLGFMAVLRQAGDFL